MHLGYRTDMRSAAKRYFRAATELHQLEAAGSQPGCRAVAGYLYGLAGELAVKTIMSQSGITPLPQEERANDPYYAHFPELRTRLRETISGRREQALRFVAENQSLFQFWDTDMRYAPTQDVKEEWINAWSGHAKNLLDQMDI